MNQIALNKNGVTDVSAIFGLVRDVAETGDCRNVPVGKIALERHWQTSSEITALVSGRR
jgi:hypothetical protein